MHTTKNNDRARNLRRRDRVIRKPLRDFFVQDQPIESTDEDTSLETDDERLR